jgi:apolipoprotein N-acyltransferase
MINITNTTFIEEAGETSLRKAGSGILWLISHPVWLLVIIVVVFILILLYTVWQNKMDGTVSAALIGGFLMFGLFAALLLFLLGLKMGHYPSIERWSAELVRGIFNIGNSTIASNMTNISG